MARRRFDVVGFREYLGNRGLSTGTMDVYCRDLALAGKGGNLTTGIVARLRDDKLAPKTRRHILAAGRRWADFADDDALTKRLKELRLPPPRRKTAKVPITRDELLELVDELGRADYLTRPMKAVLGMMACRGFRCGDVLRLRRVELEAAREHGLLAYEAKGRRRIEYKVLKTYRRWVVMLADSEGDWDRVCDLISPEAGAGTVRGSAAKAVSRSLTDVAMKVRVHGLYPHRLRRTYAVEYLRSMRGDPEALVKLTQHMGWASMATAMEYIDHARGDELDKYAEQIFERE